MKSSELTTYIFNETEKLMLEAGFTPYPQKKLRGWYCCKINEGCEGIISVEVSVHRAIHQYSFVVGTRVYEVEELVDKYFPPESRLKQLALFPGRTVRCGTSEWLPNNRIFSDYRPAAAKDVDRELPEAIRVIAINGRDFMQTYSNKETIYRSLDTLGFRVGQFSLPVLCYLMKDNERAEKYIRKTLLSLPAVSIHSAARKFGEDFLGLIEHSN